MIRLLFVLALAGCTAQASSKSPDAGAPVRKVTDVYLQNKAKYVAAKYYPKCVQLCYHHTGSDDCPDKCQNDFERIFKFMVRSVREDKEDDFDEVMESWYGPNVKP